MLRLVSSTSLAFALCFIATRASAADEGSTPSPSPSPPPSSDAKEDMVIWPTVTPAGDSAGPPPHRPEGTDGALMLRAQELDATLRDAAQDLGFDVALGEHAPSPTHMRDADILERTTHGGTDANDKGTNGSWVVSPRIEALGGDIFLVRIVVAERNARELRVRVATVKGAEVAVRGLIMLRDLIARSPAAESAKNEQERERAGRVADLNSVPPPRSQGRAILAVNGAALGGFLAFSIQRATVVNDANADDPRVLLPLLTLGTGVGLGASLLAAEEWDVTLGDAWYLAAGAWWGVASGFFIASGRDIQPLNARYLWGAGGGLIGVTLSVVALTQKSIDEGGALLTHSGGALGLYVGSAVQLLYKGSFDRPPPTGQGIGAAVGVIGAGILATQIRISSSRVLLLDVGAGLGGLVGAAATSALVFRDTTPAKTSGFIAATLSGSIIGATTAMILTRNRPATPSSRQAPKSATTNYGEPMVGPIGSSATRFGTVPAYGIGWHGEF